MGWQAKHFSQLSNGWFWAFGICIGLQAYWGGAGLELRLINMDERIAVGTRYFVVDPAWWAAAPLPRIPTRVGITLPSVQMNL